MNRKIKLGDKVKDKHTDLEGIVTAICHYLYGCTQMEIQPQKLVDGKVVDGQWVDEPQLELIVDNGGDDVKPRYGGVRNHPR